MELATTRREAGFTLADLQDALREVIDPELGVNVVDLGLVYEMRIDGTAVRVVMTMTTPGCPVAGFIEEDVTLRLRELGASSVQVDVVWDPPWSPELMSAEVRAFFGFG